MQSLASSLPLARDSQLSLFSIADTLLPGVLPAVTQVAGSPPLHRVKPLAIHLCIMCIWVPVYTSCGMTNASYFVFLQSLKLTRGSFLKDLT